MSQGWSCGSVPPPGPQRDRPGGKKTLLGCFLRSEWGTGSPILLLLTPGMPCVAARPWEGVCDGDAALRARLVPSTKTQGSAGISGTG